MADAHRAPSVLLAGGGTAGHVNPLLAVADELLRRHPNARLTVLGTAEGLESRLVPEHGLPLAVVPRVPLPIGNGEQRLNAAAVVAAGGGLLVDDADLDPAWIRAHLPELLVGDEAAETRERMGRAAASVGVRDAAARVARLVEKELP